MECEKLIARVFFNFRSTYGCPQFHISLRTPLQKHFILPEAVHGSSWSSLHRSFNFVIIKMERNFFTILIELVLELYHYKSNPQRPGGYTSFLKSEN